MNANALNARVPAHAIAIPNLFILSIPSCLNAFSVEFSNDVDGLYIPHLGDIQAKSFKKIEFFQRTVVKATAEPLITSVYVSMLGLVGAVGRWVITR